MKKVLLALVTTMLFTALAPAAVASHAIDLGAYVQPQGSETTIQAFQRFEAAGGQLDLTRHYLTDWTDSTFGGFIAWSAAQPGHHPYISLHATDTNGITWPAVAAGTHDAFLTSFAQEMQALGVPVWFVFQHEPENDTFAGTAADFKAATIHVYDLMKPLCPNCQIGPVFMRGTFTGGHGGHLAWMPDPAHMDFVGADLYSNYGQNIQLATLASPSLTYARSVGKPYFIGEAGHGGTNAQQKTFIQNARTYLKNNTDIVAFCYSETNAVGGDFRLSTATGPLNAWKAMTGDPYFQ